MPCAGSRSRRTRRCVSSSSPRRTRRRDNPFDGVPMAALNIGLIGLGRLGRVYARDFSTRLPQTRLTVVADTNGQLAQQIAAEFGVAAAYDDPSRLIDDKTVDAVVVVSPTHTHRDVVVEALKAGKPTFCEKPPPVSL